MRRTLLALWALLLLPASAMADTLQTELQRFASPAVSICTSTPQQIRTYAHELISGQQGTAATLEQVQRFLNTLPPVESDDPTLGYVANLDASSVIKVAAAVCVLENLYTLQPDAPSLVPILERATFYLLFWQRAIPEDLLLKAAAMQWAPDYQENQQFLDAARNVARGIVQGATRSYAFLALKMMPDALKDPLFLNRLYTYLGWAGGYKGQVAAAELVYAKTVTAPNCRLVTLANYRALDRSKGESWRADCKKQFPEDEAAKKMLDAYARLSKVAGDKAGKTDTSSLLTYAAAAYDLARTTEARKILTDLYTGGNRSPELIHRLALTQISEGAYVQAIDTLTQLPDNKWTKDTANALGGAAGQLLFGDVLRGAGLGGSAGALQVLQGQANWFTNVLTAIGRHDARLAGLLHALYQAGLSGLSAASGGWSVAGEELRNLLYQVKKEAGVDASWARVAALSALMDNRSTASRPLLREAISSLDPSERVYVDTLCFLVMLDYLGMGSISKEVRKEVESFQAIGEPAYFLGTAIWLLGRRSGDVGQMSEGYDIVLSSVPGLKDARTRLLALNNLAIMEASVGKYDDALESLQEAAKLDGPLEDRVLVQTNLAALEARRNGPTQGVVQFLMSVVSSNQSANWLRAAAGRMLLSLGATEAGIKTLSLEQAITEAESELKTRGMYVPDQQMVVVAEPNLSINTFADYDGSIRTELILSLRIQLALWLNPVGK